MRLRWLPLVPLLLASCGSDEERARPDVVFLMLDTTRADQLGPYSSRSPSLTPFLDRLAESCVVFENAWTASTCTAPSIASMFTGLIPPRHGVEVNLTTQAGPLGEGQDVQEFLSSVELVALPGSVPTLTEHLKSAGYETLGIGSNPNFCAALGFDRGFEHFSESEHRDAQAMAREFRRLSAELDDERPAFIYLHFMDPHAPYEQRDPWCPHAQDERCPAQCRYRSEVSFLDAELEALFADQGWLEAEDTILILVTDHGEEFREHGNVMHRFSVHQELARAGLLIRAPGLAAGRSALPAHHTDLLPSLLSWLDLPPPATCDGAVLDPDVANDPDRPLLTYRSEKQGEHQLWGLTVGRWRLLEELPAGTVRLYDLQADPTEHRELAAERPLILADLRERLALLRAGISPLELEHVTVDLTESLSEALSRLGYVDED